MTTIFSFSRHLDSPSGSRGSRRASSSFLSSYPETLMHRGKTESPAFMFILTGDALYSLEDPEAQQVWSVILSLTSVKILCDRRELELRGISIERLRMKYPDHRSTRTASAWMASPRSGRMLPISSARTGHRSRTRWDGSSRSPRTCTAQPGMVSSASRPHSNPACPLNCTRTSTASISAMSDRILRSRKISGASLKKSTNGPAGRASRARSSVQPVCNGPGIQYLG